MLRNATVDINGKPTQIDFNMKYYCGFVVMSWLEWGFEFEFKTVTTDSI